MMKLFTPVLVVLLGAVLPISLIAQNINLERELPSVTQEGSSSVLGFASGLNSPQINAVDFNRDGLQDLFIFDRVGNTPLAFRKSSSGNWVLDQDLLAGFPEIEDWVLLRDYDNDGVEDIFTFNQAPFGVRVFKGRYNGQNRLEFDRVQLGNSENILLASTPGGGTTQVYVSNIDYPDINDVDCDGDLDVVTFNLSGGFIEFYRNRSVELGYGRDSLVFQLADNCFGGVFESGISEFLDLADSADECATGFGPGELENRHVGSTLLTLDEDGDGDKDLILGDLSFGNLNMSTNGGSCEDAWMTEQDAFFPSYNFSANLPLFPAAFYVDVNADGIRDLLVAPNSASNAQDFENVWFYRNDGTDDNPNFDLDQTDFLGGEMIDLGTRAKPALLDYNADGLMDLVVGNLSFFAFAGIKNSRLYLYENTGTASAPAFTLVDDDFLNMTAFSADLPPGTSTWSFAPTFGDLDNDGDDDAVVGELNGRLFYFENTAGAGNPVSFGPAFYGYMNIDIGQHSAPQIVDLNRDGLIDLAVGERVGSIRYFQNQGTPEEPFFSDELGTAPNVEILGGVDTRIPGQSTGYSTPFFVDFDNRTELFVGSEHATIEHFGNITGNLDGTFDILSENILDHPEGDFLSPILYDWNNDGFLDMVIGNERGGLSYFSTNVSVDGVVNSDEAAPALGFDFFPNPAGDRISLELGEEWGTTASLEIYNASGQLMREEVARMGRQQISLSGLPTGVYWLRLVGPVGERIEKLVVQ
ncbi:MAG: T9SS type A sorting domain-containing protein [Bacteroidota bacterium]